MAQVQIPILPQVQGPTYWTDNQNLQSITQPAVIGATQINRQRRQLTDLYFEPIELPQGASEAEFRFVSDVTVARGQEGQQASNYQTLHYAKIAADIALYQVASYTTHLARRKAGEPIDQQLLAAFGRAMARAQNDSAISSFNVVPLAYGDTSTTIDQTFLNTLTTILDQGVEQTNNEPFVESLPAAVIMLNHGQLVSFLNSITANYSATGTGQGRVAAASQYNPDDYAMRNYSARNGFQTVDGGTILTDNNIPITSGGATGLAWERGAMVRILASDLNELFPSRDHVGTRQVYNSYWGHATRNPKRCIRVVSQANAVSV